MASVFLSYDREDSDRARHVAQALEKAGHRVWWDLHIKTGAQYSTEIDRALNEANAVVVLWSERSVESPWVRDEAAAGRDAGKLVPARIDGVSPPLGFRQYQTTDLSRWKGRRTSEFEELLVAVASLVDGSKDQGSRSAPVSAQPKRWRLALPLAVGLAVLAVIAAGLIAWRFIARPSSVPLVAVAAADASPASQALARDLLVKLGRLQAARPDAIDLVGGDTARKAVLTIHVGSSGSRQQTEASLALIDANNRSLLWSKDFSVARGNDPDLRQQLAYSAAQVLKCATETMIGKRAQVTAATRKLYLNACAEFAESLGGDISPVVPMFEQVTRTAPGFRGGWAKLLLAQTEWAAGYGSFKMTVPQARKRSHISEARKRFSDLPEIPLAELSLLPHRDYARRMALADRANELGPTDPFVLAIRAVELLKVGRSNEAVISAQRAVEFDPTSPAIRHTFINTLTYSGRLEWAREEIAEAEGLWPGASSVEDAKSRFHARYGDPAIALAILKERRADPVMEAFLRARIRRTPENIDEAVRQARAALSKNPTDTQSLVAFVQALGEFGREEELYSTLLAWRGDLAVGYDVFFRPALKKFRQDSRFMQIAKRGGWLAYWHSSGNWPDFCLERDLPYDCAKEARKYI